MTPGTGPGQKRNRIQMANSSTTLGELESVPKAGGLDVTALTRLKHADLWAAAKKLGSQAALARKLGVQQSLLGRWVNMRACPPKIATRYDQWTTEKLAALELELFNLTGKTLDELFPDSLRENAKFLESPRVYEKTKRLEAEDLEEYARLCTDRAERLASPEVDRNIDNAALAESFESAFKRLSYREREVIKLRYGLGDTYAYTLEEVAHIFKVTRERIRQIEKKAIRRLQQPSCSMDLAGYLDDHGVGVLTPGTGPG